MEKAKTEKKPKPPQPTEALVQHALKLAATKPNAKWTGASAAVLFNTKESNHETAIAECTTGESPLLKQVGKGGVLTAAGFERIAQTLTGEEARDSYDRLREELPEDQIGFVARAMAKLLAASERIALIEGVIRRTPLAATELTPLLEEAVAAEKAEHETRIAVAAKRKAAEDAAKKALERAIQLFDERRQNRLDALRREWEAEGGDLTDLAQPEAKSDHGNANGKPRLEPTTSEDKDFRRDVADQLAAAWRAAWDANKTEARDYLESAMWNVSGLKLAGEAGARLAFDGRYHECAAPVFTGDAVKIARPGWTLDEEGRDYVVLKAVVEKA